MSFDEAEGDRAALELSHVAEAEDDFGTTRPSAAGDSAELLVLLGHAGSFAMAHFHLGHGHVGMLHGHGGAVAGREIDIPQHQESRHADTDAIGDGDVFLTSTVGIDRHGVGRIQSS